jgi:hypothetical protein
MALMTTFDKAYRAALKATAKDAREISGGKIAPHLRVATRSHATYSARRTLVASKHTKISDLAKTYHAGSEPGFTGTGGGSSDELLLYMDNDEPTYRQMESIKANMIRHLRRGSYSQDRAPAGWIPAADFGSQRYKKEIGTEGIEFQDRGQGSHAYSATVRREVAAYLAWRFLRDAQSGEFDE